MKKASLGTVGLAALMSTVSALNVRSNDFNVFADSGNTKYFSIGESGPVNVRNTNLDLNGGDVNNISNLAAERVQADQELELPARDEDIDKDNHIWIDESSEELKVRIKDKVFTAKASFIPESVLEQDLVAWYRFEDGDARDYTATFDADFADPTAYDGDVDGATFESGGGATDFKNGQSSGLVDFDGTDDRIDLANFSLSSQTIMGWVNSDQSSAGTGNDCAAILGHYGGGSQKYLLICINGEDLGYRIDDGDDSFKTVANASFSTGEWYHVALSYNQTDGSTVAYLNGEVVGSINYSSSIVYDANKYYIGYQKGADHYWDGRADDVRIYNRALADSEIADIYNATKP